VEAGVPDGSTGTDGTIDGSEIRAKQLRLVVYHVVEFHTSQLVVWDF